MVSMRRTAFVGAVVGAVAGIAVLLFLIPMLIGKVTATPVGDGTARVSTAFEFSEYTLALPELLTVGDTTIFTTDITFSPLFMLSLFGVIGFGLAGLLTAGLTRWIPSVLDPGAKRHSRTSTVLAAGAGTGAVVGILAAQGAVTWLGTYTATAQVGVVPFLLTLVAGGIVLGSGVASTSHLLSRPDVLGLSGPAWDSRQELWSKLKGALAGPIVAMVVMVGLVAGLALALLNSSHTAALILAGLVAVAVLGFAALAAYRGEPR